MGIRKSILLPGSKEELLRAKNGRVVKDGGFGVRLLGRQGTRYTHDAILQCIRDHLSSSERSDEMSAEGGSRRSGLGILLENGVIESSKALRQLSLNQPPAQL